MLVSPHSASVDEIEGQFERGSEEIHLKLPFYDHLYLFIFIYTLENYNTQTINNKLLTNSPLLQFNLNLPLHTASEFVAARLSRPERAAKQSSEWVRDR